MRHNNIVPDYPCAGEVIQLDEFSTDYIQVARCSERGTEVRFEADSDGVDRHFSGMRKPITYTYYIQM